MPHSLRLAFVVRGAVSLGAYESGVLYELLQAIERHNRRAARPRLEIDTLVGASAGAMTSAMAAHLLAGGGDRLRAAHDNPFYQVWVRQTDLAGLLALTPADNPKASLLSGTFVAGLARQQLSTMPAGPGLSAAPADPQQPIRVAFALSNLRGLDYDVVTRGSPFPYTRFQDEWRGEVHPGRPAQTDWTGLCAAALASGAFAAAFPPRGILRRRTDYNTTYLSAADWPDTEPERELPYSDGGMFNNEPLGLAKELVDCVDRHRDEDHRFYLYISPSPQQSEARPGLRAADLTLLQIPGTLLHAISGQAQYQDLADVEKTNRRVASLDDVAARLAATLGDETRAAALAPSGAAVAAAAFPTGDPAPTGEESLAEAQQRLTAVYAGEPWYAQHLTTAERRETWSRLLAALERTAHLQRKDRMTLLTICASDIELLGTALAHFGGFTCEAARHFDYELGRAKAQRWICPAPGEPANPLNLDATPADFEAVDLATARTAALAAMTATVAPVGTAMGDRVAAALEANLALPAVLRPIIRWGVSRLAGHVVAQQLQTKVDDETRIAPLWASYDDVRYYAGDSNRAAVRQGALWGFVDEHGRLVIPCQYAAVQPFNRDGRASVHLPDGPWFMIDRDGRPQPAG